MELATAWTGFGDERPILFRKSTGGEWFSVTETERQTLLFQIQGLSKQQTLRLQLLSSLEIKNLKQFVKCHVWFITGAQFNKSHLLLIPEREGREGGRFQSPSCWGKQVTYSCISPTPGKQEGLS